MRIKIAEYAANLGVSKDTILRWERAGRPEAQPVHIGERGTRWYEVPDDYTKPTADAMQAWKEKLHSLLADLHTHVMSMPDAQLNITKELPNITDLFGTADDQGFGEE